MVRAAHMRAAPLWTSRKYQEYLRINPITVLSRGAHVPLNHKSRDGLGFAMFVDQALFQKSAMSLAQYNTEMQT